MLCLVLPVEPAGTGLPAPSFARLKAPESTDTFTVPPRRASPVSQAIVVVPFWLIDQMVSTTGFGVAVMKVAML